MSALTPNIKTLRAEAKALDAEADRETADPWLCACLGAMAKAKRAAADDLEAEEQALAARLHSGTETR